MPQTPTRARPDDPQVRYLQLDAHLVRETPDDGGDPVPTRTVQTLAVPYNETIDYLWWQEEFAPGSVDLDQLRGLPMFWRHGEHIGYWRDSHDTDGGPVAAGRISETPTGQDAYQLSLDAEDAGTSMGASLGFRIVDMTTETRDGLEVDVFTKVDLIELSLTPTPAYPQARVVEVREHPSPEAPMPTPPTPTTDSPAAVTRDDLDALEARLLDHDSSRRERTPATLRELGETARRYVTALRSRDFSAPELRALADTTTVTAAGFSRPAFIDDILRLTDGGRATVDALGVRPLPASGLTVQYIKQTAATTVVGGLAEKADITPSTAYASSLEDVAVNVAKGGSDVSVELLYRSSPEFAGELLLDFVGQYNENFNADAVAMLETATQTEVITLTDSATLGASLGAAAAQIATGTKRAPRVVILDPTRFFSVAAVAGLGYPLAGGNVGNANLAGLEYSAFGLRFVCDPTLAVPGYMVEPESTRVWEDPSSPMPMTADVPSKAGVDYAVFGFTATALRRPAGVVKLTLV